VKFGGMIEKGGGRAMEWRVQLIGEVKIESMR